VKVHQPWIDNPELFVEYLLTLPGCHDRCLVLDLVNSDGNCEPGNLVFVTEKEQLYKRQLLRNPHLLWCRVRQAAGLSIDDVAYALGVSRTTVSNFDGGRYRMMGKGTRARIEEHYTRLAAGLLLSG
jgi:hypothetical protein